MARRQTRRPAADPPKCDARAVWGVFLAGLLALPLLAAADGTATPADRFDCVDAFDLIATATLIRCVRDKRDDADTVALTNSAKQRLVAHGFFSAQELDAVDIAWCPLTRAMGFTADATRIYLDAGLKHGTPDLAAEVLAHEMVHTRQFRRRGATDFKCAYVNAFVACGACQDRGHPAEAEAYALQDRVRSALLDAALSAP